MYPGCATRVTLYDGLQQIDADLAAEARLRGCPHCGGPLDRATWQRKPRGCDEVPEEAKKRHGLCCRSCRRRVLPPSTLFLGRKVYWGAVVLISVAVRQRRTTGITARRLRELFGVSAATLQRWMAFFAVEVPESSWWKGLRGRIPPNVRDDSLPDALLAEFDRVHGAGEQAIAACLSFLAGGGSLAFRGGF